MKSKKNLGRFEKLILGSIEGLCLAGIEKSEHIEFTNLSLDLLTVIKRWDLKKDGTQKR